MRKIMKKKRRLFLRGEFPIVFAVLCAMFLRLAFYPESRTPIALYGTIIGAVLFVITAFISWRLEKSDSKS
jgi:hypothetical protein